MEEHEFIHERPDSVTLPYQHHTNMPPLPIDFVDPITGGGAPNGTPQYDPVNTPWDFSKIPKAPGVYIWGMKVKVNGKEYFAPWYVGEGDLRTRLETHYFGLFSRGAYNYGLFDFSQQGYVVQDINDLYDSMKLYVDRVNPRARKKLGLSTKLVEACAVPKLIYWQDNRFLYNKSNNYNNIVKCNIKDQAAIMPSGLLDQIHSRNPTSNAKQLKGRIARCKRNFDHGFYFIYWKHSLSGPYLSDKGKSLKNTPNKAIKADLVAIEHATQKAFMKKPVEIYTIAKAQGAYPGNPIKLPAGTDFVHDLWDPAKTRMI